MGEGTGRRRKPELLMPAASLEVLRTAVVFGADAVYIGGEAFGLRAKAKNFSPEEMAEGIVFAHNRGVKVYVTANIFAHNSDLAGAERYFQELRDMKPEPCDGLIISDPGMFALARRVWPEGEIHISTQANSTNCESFRFWRQLGAKRVVAARELSLEEIRDIRKQLPEDMEIECFVHGAMCISYSGRCLLSSYFTGRDANQGACTHPCRWKYSVAEETRPGEYLPVYENERGTFLFNSRDLCMVEYIPELVEAGIDSLKVEGRMKTALYVAMVARAYRRAIDDYFDSPETYRSGLDWYRAEAAKCTHRQFSTGFYFGKPGEESQIYDSSTYVNEYVYLGAVEEVWSEEETQAGRLPWMGKEEPAAGLLSWTEGGKPAAGFSLVRITQRNKFSQGDMIEIMKPDGRNLSARVEALYSQEGVPMESCPHGKQVFWALLSGEAGQHDLLRTERVEQGLQQG